MSQRGHWKVNAVSWTYDIEDLVLPPLYLTKLVFYRFVISRLWLWCYKKVRISERESITWSLTIYFAK
jgi:hypothetical protein